MNYINTQLLVEQQNQQQNQQYNNRQLQINLEKKQKKMNILTIKMELIIINNRPQTEETKQALQLLQQQLQEKEKELEGLSDQKKQIINEQKQLKLSLNELKKRQLFDNETKKQAIEEEEDKKREQRLIAVFKIKTKNKNSNLFRQQICAAAAQAINFGAPQETNNSLQRIMNKYLTPFIQKEMDIQKNKEQIVFLEGFLKTLEDTIVLNQQQMEEYENFYQSPLNQQNQENQNKNSRFMDIYKNMYTKVQTVQKEIKQLMQQNNNNLPTIFELPIDEHQNEEQNQQTYQLNEKNQLGNQKQIKNQNNQFEEEDKSAL